MLFLALSLVLAVLMAALLTACAGLHTRPLKLLSIGLLVYANLILTGEITGTFGYFSTRWAWLLLQTGLTAAAAGVWWRRGQPALNFRIAPPTLRRAHFRQHVALWVMGAAVVAVYAVGIFIILYVPPNEWDTITYRLTRAAYWLQHGSLMPWDTQDYRQVIFPFNAELLWAWTMLGWGTDALVGFTSWVVTLSGAVGVIALARLFKLSRAQSLFAALLWLLLPLTVMQSYSTQNDVLTGFCALCALLFFYIGLRQGQTAPLLLSGVAVGLAIGTKSTALFFLPGLALVALFLWLQAPKARFRLMLTWALASIAGFMLFGMYVYAMNYAHTGNPFITSHLFNIAEIQATSPLDRVGVNTVRYIIQFGDVDVLPMFISTPLIRERADWLNHYLGDWLISPNFASWLYGRIPPLETTMWFGPLIPLLMLPGLLYALYRGVRERDLYLLGLVIIPVVFVVVHSAALNWTPYRGRYHVPIIMIAAPLLAWPYFSAKLRPVRWGAVAVAVFIAAYVTNFNMLRGFHGEVAVWNHDEIGRSLLARQDFTLPYLLEEHVPAGAVLTVTLSPVEYQYNLEYLFFGRDLQYRLIPVQPSPQVMTLEALSQQQPNALLGTLPQQPTSDYIIIHQSILDRMDTAGWQAIGSSQDIHLFRRGVS